MRYGDVVAVDGLCLGVEKAGRITTILGPNGAGKTTPLRPARAPPPHGGPRPGAGARPGGRAAVAPGSG